MGNKVEAIRRIEESRKKGFFMFKGQRLDLNDLELTSNDIMQLIPRMQKRLPNLKILVLSYNKITSVPNGLRNLNLELLNINNIILPNFRTGN